MKSKDYKKKKTSYKKDIKSKGIETDASNDVSWYIPSEQLLKDVASFSYAYPLGARLNVGAYGADINNSSIPGIMAIKTSITYGHATEMESPINVASRKMFTYIRHANSGRSNYDAPDLMIYIAAMDQAFAFLSWMRRLYGVMSTYNSQNRYYARAAVVANGADFDNLITNLANFRTYINTYALKIASMCIPSDLGFVNKHMWMFENIYVDKEIDKAQTYMFVPDHSEWRQFALFEDAGALKNIFEFDGSEMGDPDDCYLFKLLTLADIHHIGKNIIEPILDEQDFQIMSGDILKAYGADKVYKAYGITETYSVVPVYDSSVLDQIQNATLIGKPQWDKGLNGFVYPLVQSPSTTSPFLPNGNVYSAPKFKHPYGFGASLADAGANIWLCDRIVTFENNSPTPQQMMEATRLCNIATSYNLEDDTFVVETIGSEVAQSACIYQFMAVDDGEGWVLNARGPLHVGVTQVIPFDSTTNIIDPTRIKDELQSNHALVQALSQFSRHPMVALTSAVADPVRDVVHYGVVNGMLFEIDNYTYVNKENLKMMSEQALLGQLKSYQFG